jgi:hypothetical protein
MTNPLASRPDAQLGGEQERLPGVRTRVVAEERLVVAARDPVGPPFLHVGPANRQPGGGVEFLENDRPVAQRRADKRVAPARQGLKECVQRLPVDRRGCTDTGHRRSLHTAQGCEDGTVPDASAWRSRRRRSRAIAFRGVRALPLRSCGLLPTAAVSSRRSVVVTGRSIRGACAVRA